MSCADLNDDIYQLAVVLHPPEFVNEKFLIKLRDCVLKLPETHPLKKWMKWMGRSLPLSKEDQETRDFLSEILNSRFNLITDQQMKKKIITILHHFPENTLPELLLKSYLYLMMGNITRSDNILRDFINAPPRVNWERVGTQPSIFHKLAKEQMTQLFYKLGKHPADRKVLSLTSMYLKNYYNDLGLLDAADDVDSNEIETKIGLKFIRYLAPSFVDYLRMKDLPELLRVSSLRDFKKFPMDEQAYWIWPFLDIGPLISDAMNVELVRLEKEDELWFVYLMENEKLADVFSSKAGKSFLPGRRPFLKLELNNERDFMMALYKLIELGDINKELVEKAVNFLIHE